MTKVAQLDYDAIATLVSDYEELRELNMAAFSLGRPKEAKPLMPKPYSHRHSLRTRSGNKPKKLNEIFAQIQANYQNLSRSSSRTSHAALHHGDYINEDAESDALETPHMQVTFERMKLKNVQEVLLEKSHESI